MNIFIVYAFVSAIFLVIGGILLIFGILRKRKEITITSIIVILMAMVLFIGDIRGILNTSTGTIIIKDANGDTIQVTETLPFHPDLKGKTVKSVDETGKKITFSFGG